MCVVRGDCSILMCSLYGAHLVIEPDALPFIKMTTRLWGLWVSGPNKIYDGVIGWMNEWMGSLKCESNTTCDSMNGNWLMFGQLWYLILTIAGTEAVLHGGIMLTHIYMASTCRYCEESIICACLINLINTQYKIQIFCKKELISVIIWDCLFYCSMTGWLR